MKKISLFCLCLAFVTPLLLKAQKLDMDKLEGLKPRSIGPAGMSGRITAIDAVVKNSNIIYAGSASGGLWKTENGGTTWKPIFDDQKAASIGAIAINQNNPDEIWVGTGEGNPRNSVNMGYGVYKSQDGGKTWALMGLEKTRNIHRVVIHRDNPDVVYVAAIGSPFGEHPERGVFKTTDGGKTWKKVLFSNNKSGASDLVMDPSNPNKLIAAMWEHRRYPWYFTSGGEGSGLYMSYDGGENWKKLGEKEGLPKGELGRIGLAIARSNPNIVYAVIESKKNAVYRSEDGGQSWKMTTDKDYGGRPFYYHEIYVDPQNENRLYSLHTFVSVSEDGGKTFKTLMPGFGNTAVHLDHHAWWMHPNDGSFLIDGNDGGLNISRDRGKTWTFIDNLPVGQFYHVSVDMEQPYNVYGGMQDNGSWRGPAYTWRIGGILNTFWDELYFGDGFDVIPDASDARYCYAMSQGGNLARVDIQSGYDKFIQPVHPEGIELRFNWNAGIAQDLFNKSTIYYGSQFLHKSSNRGDSWEIISPDLTTNDKEKIKLSKESGGKLTFDITNAENHCTILAIAPSPKKDGVIWVGTDDGNLQLTQDGGKSWKNLILNIKGVPAGTWIPQIQASVYNEGEAFVIFDNHRRDDWTPYVFHTKDFGKTWIRLADESKVWGYALSIVQDPVEPKLMFLGTEFGLYVSIDAGASWTKWTKNYPTASTMDMVIHPREHDLVIGTFGRAFYVLDDIRPLREMAQKGINLLEKPLHAFKTPDAVLAEYKSYAGMHFPANAVFQGENRPRGAMLTFAIKEIKTSKKEGADEKKENTASTISSPAAPTDSLKVKVEILDASNKVIRTLRISPKVGINRFFWDLSQKGVRFPAQPKPRPDAPEPGGFQVLPGVYTVRYTYGNDKDSTIVNVLPDPRLKISNEALSARKEMYRRMYQLVETSTATVDKLRDAKETTEIVTKKLNGEDQAVKDIKKTAKNIQDSIKVLTELIIPKEGLQGIFRTSDVASAKIFRIGSYLNSSLDAPDESQKILLGEAEKSLNAVLTRVNAFFEKDWKNFQTQVENSKFSLFDKFEPLKIRN